ncbi:putative glucan endo-1,3-beta-glucosidase GVI [Magnolia sinica]|uniref:putative glucan endo-1,3-beta-glucosidase GVI n=1 Tax=Magnolia sinica TaxID=86752 RepID=UPI002658790C|nr:putative glucan endo-1,3-beta-glucosidase GVI [Magnolia sinica]
MEEFVSMKGFIFHWCGGPSHRWIISSIHYQYIICWVWVNAVAQSVGVNYGMLGDNLPTPDKVVELLKSRKIKMVRLFDPNPGALKALEGSGIDVILGVRNEDLQKLGSDSTFAATWVSTNVVPHANAVHFRYVSAGNEVIPSGLAVNVLPAIKNIATAVKAANLPIPVSTTVGTQVLGASFPPSSGSFSEEVGPIMAPIVAYLEANRVPLLVNVYPYFAYAADPKNVGLDYALFNATKPVVIDGTCKYFNLFDAMIDAVYSALEKVGGPSVEIVVSETGWPSRGNGNMATIPNAMTYNNNLITHLNGTPKRPGKEIETYIFAIFNEDEKPVGTEQNFGLYYPNMTEVYHVDFP